MYLLRQVRRCHVCGGGEWDNHRCPQTLNEHDFVWVYQLLDGRITDERGALIEAISRLEIDTRTIQQDLEMLRKRLDQTYQKAGV